MFFYLLGKILYYFYTLHLMIDDPIVKGDAYDLTQDFVIE